MSSQRDNIRRLVANIVERAADNATAQINVVRQEIERQSYVSGSGTAGQVAYFTAPDTIASEAQLSLTRGGTGANLSATGPGLLQQATAGGAITVAPTPAGRLLVGAAGSAGVATFAGLAWDEANESLNIENTSGSGRWALRALTSAAGGIGIIAEAAFIGDTALQVASGNAVFSQLAEGVAYLNSSNALRSEAQLSVIRGGTGAATLTLDGVLLGSGTSAIFATAAGTANQVFRVPSGGGTPGFGAIDLGSASAVTGVLAKANQNAQTAYLDAANVFTDAQKVERLGASSTIFALLELYSNTTATPTNALGTQITLGAESSTTNSQGQAAIRSGWVDVTHATRKGFLSLRATDTATREFLRGEATGSAAALAFFGGATAATKQTITGSRGGNAALASLLTALSNYGLITDSSTA